jgi:hypothetical protein
MKGTGRPAFISGTTPETVSGFLHQRLPRCEQVAARHEIRRAQVVGRALAPRRPAQAVVESTRPSRGAETTIRQVPSKVDRGHSPIVKRGAGRGATRPLRFTKRVGRRPLRFGAARFEIGLDFTIIRGKILAPAIRLRSIRLPVMSLTPLPCDCESTPDRMPERTRTLAFRSRFIAVRWLPSRGAALP